MTRRYGQRETDTYNGNGFTGNGKLIHAIVDGRPICGSGYSHLGSSHRWNPRITPTKAPINCTKCQSKEVSE